MKALCVCPIGVGNYLLTYPACAALKKARAGLSLHLLGLRSGIGELAARDPLWDKIHIFDPTRIRLNFLKVLSILRSLRAERFDISLNFFPSNKWMYNLLPFCAGIPQRYGFAYRYDPFTKLSFLLTHRAPVDETLHDVRQNMGLAGLNLGDDRFKDKEIVFPALFGDADREWAVSYLRSQGHSDVIAVHPGSSAEHGMIYKRWPPDRFADIADRICRMLGVGCLVFGTKDEDGLKQAVAGAMSAPCTAVEPVNLQKTAALLHCCRLCLCNDAGIMHVASCGGTPTIAVFGPTDEKRNGPAGPNALTVRKTMAGFPVWHAGNVGNRRTGPGVRPSESLLSLSADEAWEQIRPWVSRLFSTTGASGFHTDRRKGT
jgi:heptosyltransferase-2